MKNVTKGFRCCGREENVTVSEALLGIVCPQCGKWVLLGEALGLSFGQAAVLTVLAIWLLG